MILLVLAIQTVSFCPVNRNCVIESGYIFVLSLEETALSGVAVTVRSCEYLAAVIYVVKFAFFHFDHLHNFTS